MDAGQLRPLIDHRYPLLFVTVSGAHLYGFPSADSDYDLRGVHVLPVKDVIGLDEAEETVEISEVRQGCDVDLVTHDVGKFFRLLLKKDGYVLEQLYSPLVVLTCPEHETLKEIVRGCITKHHGFHYLGFSRTQWDLFAKETPRRVKPLLYVYRVLLTGIHLVQTGKVEANLVTLNEEFKLPYLNDIVAQKVSGEEHAALGVADFDFHRREYERLTTLLEEAMASSHLPEIPSTREQLNNLLVRIRLEGITPNAPSAD